MDHSPLRPRRLVSRRRSPGGSGGRPRWIRRLLLATLLAVVVAVVAAPVAGVLASGSLQAAPTEWPVPGHDAGRSGYNPTAAGPAADVGPGWTFRTDSTGTRTGLAVADGVVYQGNNYGDLFAVDAGDGSQVWKTPLGGEVESPVVVAGDYVAAVAMAADDRGNELVGVNRESGTVEWRIAPDDDGTAYFREGITAAGGLVYLVGSDGGAGRDPTATVFAVDAATGEEVWRYEVPEPSQFGASAPVVLNGTLYLTYDAFGSRDEGPDALLVALDADTGEHRWETAVAPVASATVAADGVVYVSGHQVHAFDAETGDRLRTYGLRTTPFVAPAVADGTLYVPLARTDSISTNGLAAIDVETGKTRWQVGPGPERQPAVGQRHVVFGGSDGTVYAFDRSDGAPAWNYTINDRFVVDGTVAIVGDTVYVGPAPWSVFAFREGGTAVEGDALYRTIEWLRDNPLEAFGLISVLAGLLVGTLAAVLSLGVLSITRISRSPQTIFASKLFRTPYEDVAGWQRGVAHLVAGVGLTVVFGVTWGLFALILPTVLAEFGIQYPSIPLFSSGPVLGAAFVIVVLGAAWAILAYRWLPAYESRLDAPISRIRRDWGIVHLAFAVVVAVATPLLTTIFALMIFFV